MTIAQSPLLDDPSAATADPDAFVREAIRWHFSPETGSRFWLERAKDLDFDPHTDIRGFDDLSLFPNVADALRDTRVEDLIPRGYGPHPDVVGVYESGATTGAPKRVALLRDWLDTLLAWSSAQLDRHGVPHGVNWLSAVPSGPHMVGPVIAKQAAYRGGLCFSVDLDPRWVKKLVAEGNAAGAGAYGDHIVEQLAFVLRSQDIGVLMITPPVLERLARHDDLVELVNGKVSAINWVGTQMDADTRQLYRSTLFPDVTLYSGYGSTMILGNASERPGLSDDDPCVYEPFAPYMTFGVVDQTTLDPVSYGERGQVVMNHISRSLFLPNNLERDYATRVEPLTGGGDAVADIAPVESFADDAVIEGVY